MIVGCSGRNVFVESTFSESLAVGYDLFGSVLPHHDALQSGVAAALRDYFKDRGVTAADALNFLDVGGGSGITSEFVSAVCPGSSILLVDNDPDLLGGARVRLTGRKCRFLEADAVSALEGLPTGSFDAVYAAWVLHNFPAEARRKMFLEIVRVLKPGGIFVYLEKIGDPSPARVAALAKTLLSFSSFVSVHQNPEMYLAWVSHYLADEAEGVLWSDDENRDLLEVSGLRGECLMHVGMDKVIASTKLCDSGERGTIPFSAARVIVGE